MKQGRALPEVLTELKRQNESKHDYISPAGSISLWGDGETLSMRSSVSQELFGTTDLFHRQIGSALNIPAKYYDLMRTQKPELLSEQPVLPSELQQRILLLLLRLHKPCR